MLIHFNIRGLFVYTALNTLIWVVMLLTAGRIQPRDYDLKEYWTWKPAGEKPWLIRLFTKGRIWEDKRNAIKREGVRFGEDSGSSRLGSSAEDKMVVVRMTEPQRCYAPQEHHL